jgi:hypothetical protein
VVNAFEPLPHTIHVEHEILAHNHGLSSCNSYQ